MSDANESYDDEFQRMLRDFLAGKSDIDPAKLASAAGLPATPEAVAGLMQQLQSALQHSGDGINWDVATEQAVSLSRPTENYNDSATLDRFRQTLHVAALWLDEVAQVASLSVEPRVMTRSEWAGATMPVWTQLAEPVAISITDALTTVIEEQTPEEMASMLAGAGKIMRNLGGTLFAMQLGHVVGQLAQEVVSGGDVGIPLLPEQQAAVLPQNMAAFGEGLDIPRDQIELYLSVRELAHARLFRHAKWLRLHLITSIREFSTGIRIDTDRMEELATSFDPSNPEELRDAMVSGALIPPKTESQLQALSRLETTLALIEGWVDVVTAAATARLPRRDAIAETVRRRRATGGPAESAFATLVGLELRPRRLREAATMWQMITDAVGSEERDHLWTHPDLVPSSEDIDDPEALVARLQQGPPAPDAMDEALEELLREEAATNDDTAPRAPDDPDADASDGRRDDRDNERPEDK